MSPPLIPPNGFGGPPRQDDLVYRSPESPGVPVTDDLVSRGPVDPVLAALAAYGQPTTAGAQIPTGPGVQPLAAGGDPNSPGPITDPSQLGGAPPPQYQPASDTPGAAEVPVQPPLASGDVKGATKAQDAAVGAETKNILTAELAKTDALASHANSRAGIYEGHATAQGLVDVQYQRARQAARNDANAETAAWMRDLDQKVSEEPVPGRWWANTSKFGQVMYLMSLAFGAMAQAKNPNLKNIALEMITKETESDMTEQRDRIKRQIDAMKVKGEVIDRKLQAQIADAKDDHTLLASRLAMVQQAALERANAPGAPDQKAAMAEAASWAGQQRLVIAGERANKAFAERDSKLGRDAEMARALLTDKRDRDLKAAELQKDYDLARIAADVKLSGKEDPRVKNSVVLNPFTTGIRVVDQAGQPVATPLSGNGGLTIAKETEKEGRQVAGLAQDRYATMQRVSDELAKGEDLNLLLKRNPRLVSDIVKLGYGAARNELDPNGRVTDADYRAGLENALGTDLDSFAGRVKSAAGISVNQEKLRAFVEEKKRNYPRFVSNQLGALIDAAVPGYEGNVRVDWTPKEMKIPEAANPSTQQIDASYGIQTPVKPPETIDDLKRSQELQARGVEALPPYKPGSQDKVLKALADFKGALPGTIMVRAGAVERQLDETGDKRAALEIQQAQYEQIKKSGDALATVEDDLRIFGPRTSDNKPTGGTLHNAKWYDSKQLQASPEATKVFGALPKAKEEAWKRGEIPVGAVVDIAASHGLTQLTPQDVLDIIRKVGLRPYKE